MLGKTGTVGEGDADTAAFIAMVGDRVRMARNRKGISRRALSELSGVSQRYLAQLEGGDGNVSIALLRKIARSLDLEIEWLVGREDPWSSDLMTMMQLFRQATRDQRARVMEVLDPNESGVRRAGRVALIGLRGAGKSTLGRLTAKRMAGKRHNARALSRPAHGHAHPSVGHAIDLGVPAEALLRPRLVKPAIVFLAGDV